MSNKIKLIAIGASTGGTDAINTILSDMPEDTPPILIVQHMPSGFTAMYAERLNKNCKMAVREAKDKDKLQNGLCLIAPGGFQMSLTSTRGEHVVRVNSGEKVKGHAPSVDVLFNSIAQVYNDFACGVILTGMGNDGANGLFNMKRRGFLTIGQDQISSVVYGMPKAAYEKGAVSIQCNLNDISKVILKNL